PEGIPQRRTQASDHACAGRRPERRGHRAGGRLSVQPRGGRAMIRQLLSTAAVALALASSTVFAAGDAERGREKSQVCQACHGPDGNGVGDPQYPTIAGQYADYLTHAMGAYKT